MATSDLSRSGSYLVLIVLDVEHTETRTVVDEFFYFECVVRYKLTASARRI